MVSNYVNQRGSCGTMVYAVFLCDKKWIIHNILRCEPELSAILHRGVCLTSQIHEGDALAREEARHRSMFLSFKETQLTFPAFIRTFPEGYLILLSHVGSDSEFADFTSVYEQSLEWAENHLQGLYHNEYYQIQLINNQLIDSQRALARSNRKLKQAMNEIQETNIQLQNARKAAEQAMAAATLANESKTRFLANMSHDIRTPLNAIVGIASLMEHSLDNPEKMQHYIQKLQASGRHLMDLINDVLDMSKIEHASMDLRTEHLRLSDQIEQVLTMIRPQATKRRQQFTVQTDPISHEYFLGDATRLRQVMINLLSNAVKYTREEGTVFFLIQELPDTGHSRVTYRFVVTDNGIGMTEEFVKHIFEPFSRSDLSIESKVQGTGLGMSITKRIIDAMGGQIQIESVPGKGSRFEVTLSFKIDRSAAHTVHSASHFETAKSGEGFLSGMHFLCAEDNALNAEILSSMLELSGATCTIYENGKLLTEAFSSVQPGDCQAILMDVRMPVMDGYEATRCIRNSKNPLGRTIPIIAMTANAFSEDIQHSLDVGMDAHISKPIDLKALEQAMKSL